MNSGRAVRAAVATALTLVGAVGFVVAAATWPGFLMAGLYVGLVAGIWCCFY